MADPFDLTPIERGALFVLIAEGRPLKENAELKKRHGLSFTAKHREKLQRLGLIKVEPGPWTLRLTEQGWKWAEAEIASTQPKGQMGLGPLYAILNGLNRHVKQQGYSLKKIFREDHVQQAAWSEADEALAQALQDIPKLLQALDKLEEASANDSNLLISKAIGASNVVLQSVRRAAQKRELSSLSEAGSEAPFDPLVHRADVQTKPGVPVRVRKSPIIRGPASAHFVVVRGEVDAI
jgi:hypothetical protein